MLLSSQICLFLSDVFLRLNLRSICYSASKLKDEQQERKLWDCRQFFFLKTTRLMRTNILMCDFRLPPRCTWNCRSSGKLHSVDSYLVIDISGQFTKKLEDRTDRMSRKVINNYPLTLRNIPEEWSSYMNWWCLYWRCEVNEGNSCRFVARTNTVHRMCANSHGRLHKHAMVVRGYQISSNLC